MMKLLRGLMGNIYTNYKVDLATNTNPVILYTVPDRVQAVIKSIRVSDDSGSGSTITATITDAANVEYTNWRLARREGCRLQWWDKQDRAQSKDKGCIAKDSRRRQ